MLHRRVAALAGIVFSCIGAANADLINVIVPNRSFESGTVVPSATGAYSQLIAGSTIAAAVGSLDNWTASSTTANAAAGIYSPAVGANNWNFRDHWWTGNAVGYLQVSSAGTASLSQSLSQPLENNTAYLLVVNLEQRVFTARSNYTVQFWGGSTLLASVTGTPRATADFVYVRYTSAKNEPNAGQPLRIVLICTGADGAFTEFFFDDIFVQATVPPLTAPTITAGGITPVFSSSSTIQPGSWVSIYGSEFALQPTLWAGNFPTSLAGVSVTVNSKPAYLWYVSRTQINLQTPTDTTTGPVLVTVTTAQGKVSAAINLGPYGPSFSLLNGKYAAAIVITPGAPGTTGAGYDIIGPAGALPYPTRPVKAGETLVLYGVGFGPTNPQVPAGLPFYGAAATQNIPSISIGGVPAQVQFAGVVAAGLYQFNIVVPVTAHGDQPLQAVAGGLSTPGNVYLSVQ